VVTKQNGNPGRHVWSVVVLAESKCWFEQFYSPIKEWMDGISE
jgi:hypothetical protein